MATTTSSSSVKLTKAQKFALIAEIAEVKNNPILAEFIAHEVELLAKKNSADKKPTAQQEANATIKAIGTNGEDLIRHDLIAKYHTIEG